MALDSNGKKGFLKESGTLKFFDFIELKFGFFSMV